MFVFGLLNVNTFDVNGNGNGNEFIWRIFYWHIQMRFTRK